MAPAGRETQRKAPFGDTCPGLLQMGGDENPELAQGGPEERVIVIRGGLGGDRDGLWLGLKGGEHGGWH